MGAWAIAVHGGAGVDPNLPKERQEEAKRLLTRCLDIGISALRSDLPAIDVVELVVCHFFFYPFLSFHYHLSSLIQLINVIKRKKYSCFAHVTIIMGD